jgi:hypothetical protein
MEQINLIYTLAGVSVLLFIWNTVLHFSIKRLNKNQKSLFKGKKAKDLESIIIDNNSDIKSLFEKNDDLYQKTEKLNQHFLKTIHKVGLLRFNPFREIGGDQSFSLALLDDNDNGAIISSLYSREGVRIYAKSIQNGVSSKHQLTEEEKQAIKIAAKRKV